jgi:Protein of unknown function (DUF2889)
VTTHLPFVTTGPDLGPQDPTTGAPARAARSARRTSSVGVSRPEGPTGPIAIDARARDAVTLTAGAAPASTGLHVRAALDPMQALESITADPAEPALDALIGARVAAGFRTLAAAAVPEHRRDASLLYLLLDDLPVAALVSGYALQRSGSIGSAPREAYAFNEDLCSGWASDATIMRVIDHTGMPPMTLGPAAPALERDDDPLAWHEIPIAPPRSTRRRRRIDVGFGPVLEVDAMFRDSHFDDDALESVVHEYSLRASIDAETLIVTSIEATPRVLPYVECPAAAASAARLVGFHLDDVRDRVRKELVGTSTCTHLNDLLRSLEDVRGMQRVYAEAAAQS